MYPWLSLLSVPGIAPAFARYARSATLLGAAGFGVPAALHLIEWLLGDSAEAVETRRNQVVLFMPIHNPELIEVTDHEHPKRKAADLILAARANSPDFELNHSWTPPAEVLKPIGRPGTI